MKKISVIILLLGACAVFQKLPPTVREDSKQIKETKTALIEDRPGATERAMSELDRCDARNIENAKEIRRLNEALNRCNVSNEKKDVQLTKVSKEAGKGEGIRWTYYAILGFGIFLLLVLVLVVAAILALRRNGLPVVSSLLGGRIV
ncbi:hypothetical protein [Leptospira noguchii]|uniref:Uncharacterized protein n=1 Tax=Leptospira noguchii serovar Panama str. CZ214 TaxID=1001595 RepID=T0F988_9LEPT|nr:hypothetical protein [Leptospira noguchii]EQA69743.1 hypothetical protein LEP1GSC059_2349 [Leptospira noguchii serovar Panama str. CZ214]EQA70275.1 hypothetical protein LEP1GSC059_0713 [Leptospira noguchii serovar Panama str. CZ214]EQA72368.1 hypothetical protein LEP1GSC059_3678 [Leptospira noguchii serovar Panama str. CZ214]EQA72515.1 hypothetical protein LEP1GSC059_3208 [Leptospira noguchii serovar Panama str. CZ214]